MTKIDKNYIRRVKRIRTIKKIALLIALLILIGFLVINYTDMFNVKEVNCLGENLVTEEFIEKHAESLKGQNLVYIKQADVIELLKENPYIESVNIKKKYPSSIEIDVTEKKALFYIIDNKTYNIMNEESIYLEKVNSIEGKNLIEVKGANISGKALGDRIFENTRVKEILENAYELQKFFAEKFENVKITSINLSDLSKITVNFGNVVVKLGNDEDLVNKLKTAALILNQGDVKEYIDVSFNGTPDFK